MERAMIFEGRCGSVPRIACAAPPGRVCEAYHVPTRDSTTIASRATTENQAMLRCPAGSTINAASSGPSDEPVLPPTWKSDCANPCRPPDAIRATREDSGWNTADPTPTSATESSTHPKAGAMESRIRPIIERVIPAGRDHGVGRRSVYSPTTGCSNDAVSCEVRVIRPIWLKSSRYVSFKMGYTAGMTDWRVSFNRWQKLIAPRIRNAVLAGAAVTFPAAVMYSSVAMEVVV